MKIINCIATGLCIAFALNACTPKMSFVNSSIVPAASGTVVIKKDKNGNYITDVQVLNLAEPKNLTPEKAIYLAWMVTSTESAKKLGQLSPSGKALKAELTATSVAKPDQVFITAEDNPDLQFPSGQVILTTRR